MNVADKLADAQAFVAGLKAQFNAGVVPEGFACESVAVSDRGRLQVRFVMDTNASAAAGEAAEDGGARPLVPHQVEPAGGHAAEGVVFDSSAAPVGGAGWGVVQLSDQDSDALVLNTVEREGFVFPTLEQKEVAEVAARAMVGDALLAIEAYSGPDDKLFAERSIAASREAFAEAFDVALFDACIARWTPAEVANLLSPPGGAE